MYIIWSLINAAFVILFFALVLTLLFKGKKLFNNKYGNAIIVILALGVIGILNNDNDLNSTYDLTYGKELKYNSSLRKTIRLQENATSTLLASIRLSENDKGQYRPTFTRTMYSGFVGGHEWDLKYVLINSKDDGTYSYDIGGLIHWSLFGIELYTQNKEFKGTFELEEY